MWFSLSGNPYSWAKIPSRRAKEEMRTDCEGRRGGLEKMDWEICLRLDLNQRVSVIRLIRPPDPYRWDSKEQLSCLLFFISNLELKVPGWEWPRVCALQPQGKYDWCFLNVFCSTTKERKEPKCQGCLCSILCLHCAENRGKPPRKVFCSFFGVFVSVVDAAKACNFAAVLRVYYCRWCWLKCILSLVKKTYINYWGLPTKKRRQGKNKKTKQGWDENTV